MKLHLFSWLKTKALSLALLLAVLTAAAWSYFIYKAPSLFHSFISVNESQARTANLAAEYGNRFQQIVLAILGKSIWGEAVAYIVLAFLILIPTFLFLYLLFRFFKVFFFLSVIPSVCIAALYFFPNSLLILENENDSKVIGSVYSGRLENGKRIPFHGENHSTFSFPMYLLGRTHVQHQVRDALLAAFAYKSPYDENTRWVMGESAWKNGGNFFPHKSHRNGMAVDIMTPMKKRLQPVEPFGLFNLYGYLLHFDSQGKYENIEIDFANLAWQIKIIDRKARENALKIKRIIFAPELQKQLLEQDDAAAFKDRIRFSHSPSWVRHDNHYHIDFELE